MTRPLSELEAIITRVEGDPEGVRRLLFTCPISPDGHGHGIPFHDGPAQRMDFGPAPGTNVWHRDAGDTPETMTLSPSYWTRCLHVWIRDGVVVGC